MMTVTIMESYDAQMTDYQTDHDVPMHLASSDPWLQDFVSMEDDLTFHQKGMIPDTLSTIDVEMEDYVEDENIEYEMADETHVHRLTSDELLDVDILDVSAVQSPLFAMTSLPLTPAIEASKFQLGADRYSTAEVSVPIPAPASHEFSTDASVHQNSESVVTFQPDTVQIFPPVAAPLSEEPLPHRRGTPGERNDVPHTIDEQEGSSTLQPDATLLPVEPTAEIPSQQNRNVTVDSVNLFDNNNQVDSHRSGQSLEQSTSDAAPNTVNPSEAPVFFGDRSESPSRSSEVVEPVPFPHCATDGANREHEDSRPVPISSGHLQELPNPKAVGDVLYEKDSSDLQTAGETAETFNEVLNETLDENQEVPPPILLSIFSADQPELCLFNKPSEPLPNDDETQERHILFQQAASLYYEPVINAFEALRQDEYVSTVLEITGNELGLEAYQLELMITEVCFLSKHTSDVYEILGQYLQSGNKPSRYLCIAHFR